MRLLFFIMLHTALTGAQLPDAYRPMAQELQTQRQALLSLKDERAFDADAVTAFAQDVEKAFELGRTLDRAAPEEADRLRPRYLKTLRGLQKRGKKLDYRYATALRRAIAKRDTDRFRRLAAADMAPLHQPSIKKAALTYYDGIRDTTPIAVLEKLRESARLEAKSVAFLSTEARAFQQDQSVLPDSRATKDQPVAVTSRKTDDTIYLYARNDNDYPLTLTLDFPTLENFRVSGPVPFIAELEPRSRREVLRLTQQNKRASASYNARFSWVMGKLSARHSDPLYRLPFAMDTIATVSQGFDGGITHKGLTRYAVDFACPVGTKIFAARSGTVIATEASFNQGGFEERFGPMANYVIIEHDDHTLGKYYHLKQYGVMVRTGTQVARGQFIAYSGNTGYSSGPHLHFSVSSVDPQSKNLPITLPIRFETAQGVVDAPRTRDRYRVARVSE